jgi:ABC-type antimicrobial peptide transport system permease subunit
MSLAAILIALVLAFIAFRFIAGVAKLVVIAVIVIAALYFLSHGGLG